MKEATCDERPSRRSDEDRQAHIHRGYSYIVAFNEVCRDVERRMNAGEHDGEWRDDVGCPFF